MEDKRGHPRQQPPLQHAASTVLPAVEHIAESFGAKPRQLAADSGFNTGANLADLQTQGVEPLMPAKQAYKDNPALRADPTQPVATERQAALPINPQNKVLDKAAFIYDQDHDRYVWPMGKPVDAGGGGQLTVAAGGFARSLRASMARKR